MFYLKVYILQFELNPFVHGTFVYILRVYKFLFMIKESWIVFISNTRWSTRRCMWNFDDTGKKIRIFKKKIRIFLSLRYS